MKDTGIDQISEASAYCNDYMAKGSNILIGSKIRKTKGLTCGRGFPVRIIANIGTAQEKDTIEKELEKAEAAYGAGADIVTDNSLSGDIYRLHSNLLETIECQISTVPIYQTYIDMKKNKPNYHNFKRAIKIFEEQAALGFDLLTIHATILREDIKHIAISRRLIPSTSRGGMMMADMMIENSVENPYWLYFDNILDIAKEYGTTLSLGTSFRPGSIFDVPDYLCEIELSRMGILVEKAVDCGVSIMIEGIGHTRLDLIPEIIRSAKSICRGVPYRVLCVACDSAIYRDHIASAIASSVAVANGADLISAITRSEHIRQPTKEEIIEAIETAKIAAHCGEIVRREDTAIDELISKKRGLASCLAKGVQAILPRSDCDSDSPCNICGEYCALKIMQKIKTNKGLSP